MSDESKDMESSPSSSERRASAQRRASLTVDPKLASEEDAAVLAKMGYVTLLAECKAGHHPN